MPNTSLYREKYKYLNHSKSRYGLKWDIWKQRFTNPGFVCLLMFCTLATYKIMSGPAPTCDSAHSWWLYSAAPLGNQFTSTMTWYPWHWAKQSLPYPNKASRLAGKRQVSIFKSLVWLDQGSSKTVGRHSTHLTTSPHLWMIIHLVTLIVQRGYTSCNHYTTTWLYIL